jgi:hypothetical protein
MCERDGAGFADGGWVNSHFAPPTVRAELVEALPFLFLPQVEGQPFDKLRANGCPGGIRENELRANGVGE